MSIPFFNSSVIIENAIKPIPMKLKSPTEPVLLTEESFDWLEGKLAKNESRRTLSVYEKELYEGAKTFIDNKRIQCR